MDIKKIIEISFVLKNGERVKTTNQQIIKSVIDAGGSYKVLRTEIQKTDQTQDELVKSNEELTKSYSSVKEELRATKERMQELIVAGEDTGEEYQTLAKRAGQLGDAQDTVNERINAQKSIFDGAISVSRSLAGSYGAVQGTLNLLGIESEDSLRALVKLQSIMAITTGLDEISKLGDAFKGLKASIMSTTVVTEANALANKATAATLKLLGISANTTSTAFKGLKTALIATGIGALIVGIGLLIANFDKLKDALGFGKSANEKYIETQKAKVEESQRAIDNFALEEVRLRQLGATELEIARQRNKIYNDGKVAAKNALDAAQADYERLVKLNTTIDKNTTTLFGAWLGKQAMATNKQVKNAKEALDQAKEDYKKYAVDIIKETEKSESLRISLLGDSLKKQIALIRQRYTDEIAAANGNQQLITFLLLAQSAEIQKLIDADNKAKAEKRKRAAEEKFRREQTDQKRLIELTRTGLDKELALFDEAAEERLRTAKQNKEDLLLLEQTLQKERKELIKKNKLEEIALIKKLNDERYTDESDNANQRIELLNIEYEKRVSDIESLREKSIIEAQEEAEKRKLTVFETGQSISEIEIDLQNKRKQIEENANENLLNERIKYNQKILDIYNTNLVNLSEASVKNINDITKLLTKEQDNLNIANKITFEVDDFANKVQKIISGVLDGDFTGIELFPDFKKQLEESVKGGGDAVVESVNIYITEVERLYNDVIDFYINSQKTILATNKEIAKDTEELGGKTNAILDSYANANRDYFVQYLTERRKQLKLLLKDETLTIEKRKELIEKLAAVEKEILDKRGLQFSEYTKEQVQMYSDMADIVSDYFQVISDTYDVQIEKINMVADAEIAASERSRDAQLANAEYSAEQKAQIERDYSLKVKQIEAKRAAETKKIQKKQASIQLAINIAQIVSNTAVSIMRALADLGPIAGGIAAGLIGITGALQTAVAIQQYNLTKQMKRGGLITGASHENGGVLVGNTGIEVEGNEAVINKRSTKMYAPLLSAINQAGGGVPIPTPRFELGGSLPQLNNMSQNISNNKPVRAYILSKDVSSDAVLEARIKRIAKLN